MAETLRDLVLAAGTDRTMIHAYLDCEISFGAIDGGAGWTIEASTLPFHEGRRLLPRSRVKIADQPDRLAMTGDHGTTHWQIVESTMPPAELAKSLAHGGSER